MSGFVMVSNALLTHYNFYPKFNGNTLLVYAYLSKLNNAQWGYAFPSQNQAMADLGISDTTFKAQTSILQDCGLITVGERREGAFTNKIYYVHDPIETASDFYAKYPEARVVYERKQATATKVGASRRKAREALQSKVDTQGKAVANVVSASDGVDLTWL